MNEKAVNYLRKRLKAVNMGNGFFVGRCPYCGALVGFDQTSFFCMFCHPNLAGNKPDNSFWDLSEHRKEVLQILVKAASVPDKQYNAYLLLFLEMTGHYVPRSQQGGNKDIDRSMEAWLNGRKGNLTELLAQAKRTRRILRDIP